MDAEASVVFQYDKTTDVKTTGRRRSEVPDGDVQHIHRHPEGEPTAKDTAVREAERVLPVSVVAERSLPHHPASAAGATAVCQCPIRQVFNTEGS